MSARISGARSTDSETARSIASRHASSLGGTSTGAGGSLAQSRSTVPASTGSTDAEGDGDSVSVAGADGSVPLCAAV